MTTLRPLKSSPAKYLALVLEPEREVAMTRRELGARLGLHEGVAGKAVAELREAGLLQELPYKRGQVRPFVYLGVALPGFSYRPIALQDLLGLTPAQRAVVLYVKGGGEGGLKAVAETLGLAEITVYQALARPELASVAEKVREEEAHELVTLELALPSYLATWLKSNKDKLVQFVEREGDADV